MSSDRTKFYKYESSTSASLLVPFRAALQLGWMPQNYNKNDDFKRELTYFKRNIEGNLGLFLFSNKNKKQKIKFYKYASQTGATATIPLNLAVELGWTHDEEIRVVFRVIDGYKGLFFFKK